MSAPTDTAQAALKRLGRYLLGHKRVVYKYPFQRADCIDVYSDTDWSGCPRTRKSTSGGCIMIGQHCIRAWSSTQPSVTLSSGKAEYYGWVKAFGAGLGHQSLAYPSGHGRTRALQSGSPRGPAWGNLSTWRRILCGSRRKCGRVRLP